MYFTMNCAELRMRGMLYAYFSSSNMAGVSGEHPADGLYRYHMRTDEMTDSLIVF